MFNFKRNFHKINDNKLVFEYFKQQQACPGWSTWTPYSACTATCGGGTMLRSRDCLNGDAGEAGCEGNANEVAICGEKVSFYLLQNGILQHFQKKINKLFYV